MDAKWVDKAETSTTVLLADGTALGGTLHLSPLSPFHSGPQTPGELLAEPEPLLPFHLADGAFVLVGKAAVAAVRVPGTADPSELLVRLPARLRLAGGHRLEGLVLGERGAGDRLSDLLNGAQPWVRVGEGETECWVSKRHVITVEPLAVPDP